MTARARIVAALALATLTPAHVAAGHVVSQEAAVETTGPHSGVGTGLVDRYAHRERGKSFSDSKDVYSVRFTYSFRIENGRVVGKGTGVYLSATWNLSGTNDGRPFSCNIPVSATPFAVAVSGSARGPSIDLRFDISGAEETNADYDCGAGFTGYATESTFVAESLALVQDDRGGSIRVSRANPSIPPLRKLVTSGEAPERRVHLHEWAITITAPVSSDGHDPLRGGPKGGEANSSGQCTITGTPDNDVLVGTAQRDVICSLGGDDFIRGNAGDDTVRGGPGRDLLFGGAGNDAVDGGPGADIVGGDRGRDFLLTRDRARDHVGGGPGRDRAVVDRGLDRVTGVESTS